MATGHGIATAAVLRSGKVLIAGGGGNQAELYDPATNAFSPAGSMMIPDRGGATASVLSSGKVLIAGGASERFPGDLSSAELYDPATNTFSATGPMAMGRYSATASVLPSGKVLIAGGLGGAAGSAELYDPATNTFSPAGRMTIGRDNAAAAVLPSGKVLIAGGREGLNALSSAELYDPATNAFGGAGSMTTGRVNATASVLPSGEVLVAGGSLDASAELYDPASDTFTPTGSMATDRSSAAAAVLPSGRVLIAGGTTSAGHPVSSAELYDPATNTFSPAGSMSTVRYDPTASVLASGKVLVAGGLGPLLEPLSSAELFTDAGPVDDTPPTIVLSTGGLAPDARTGWYNLVSSGTGGLRVRVSASDSADVTALRCRDEGTTVLADTGGADGSFVLPDGIARISCSATDGAANTGAGPGSTAFPAIFKVDQTAPKLSLPVLVRANAVDPDGATVSYVTTTTDGQDPNPRTVCAPASGGRFAIGSTTVRCTATDTAGNRASGSFGVVVRGPRQQLTRLIALVNHFGLRHRAAVSLTAKLRLARWLVRVGHPRVACHLIDAFEHEVRFLTPKTITATQARTLTTNASRIRAVIACRTPTGPASSRTHL